MRYNHSPLRTSRFFPRRSIPQHPDLLQHASGSLVVNVVAGDDLRQVIRAKAPVDNRLRRLRGQPLTPMSHAQAITHLAHARGPIDP